MANWWKVLTESGKERWAELWKETTDMDFVPPKEDMRGIDCEVKIDPKEVEQVMKERTKGAWHE